MLSKAIAYNINLHVWSIFKEVDKYISIVLYFIYVFFFNIVNII